MWFDGEIKTSQVVSDMIGRYSLRVPRFSRFDVACRKGRIRARVKAVTDAPLTALTIRAAGKARTFTRRTVSATFVPASRRSKVRVTALDTAGLTGSRSKRIRCP